MDHFEVFDLPRRLGIDGAELQRRFYELSRRYHPDFHQAAPPEEQARALEASARLNRAYRTLRDPIARAEYLADLEAGGSARAEVRAPADLLEEMFEIQERLAEARAGGLDDAGRQALVAERERLLRRLRDEEARITGTLSRAWDESGPEDRPALIAALGSALGTRAYLRTVIDDLGAALGEDKEGHVAHRRH